MMDPIYTTNLVMWFVVGVVLGAFTRHVYEHDRTATFLILAVYLSAMTAANLWIWRGLV